MTSQWTNLQARMVSQVISTSRPGRLLKRTWLLPFTHYRPWMGEVYIILMMPSSFSYPKRRSLKRSQITGLSSLIHSFEKLFSKGLAKLLAPFLHTLVRQNQSAFIKGCFIQDNFRYVQGMAKELHRRRQPRILLKLDIAKAFDSVA